MNQKLKTSLAFTKNLLVTGAISETSRNVEIHICRHISSEANKTFVEFGMGHGNITREILKTISPTSTLYAFEVNKRFCNHVEKNCDDDRLVIINDSAENIKRHVKTPVSGVVSSIPFSFFSKEKGLAIIQNAHDLLENNSYYNQVLYTKFNFKKFQQIFEDCSLETHKNLITEYIYYCRKVNQ